MQLSGDRQLKICFSAFLCLLVSFFSIRIICKFCSYVRIFKNSLYSWLACAINCHHSKWWSILSDSPEIWTMVFQQLASITLLKSHPRRGKVLLKRVSSFGAWHVGVLANGMPVEEYPKSWHCLTVRISPAMWRPQACPHNFHY